MFALVPETTAKHLQIIRAEHSANHMMLGAPIPLRKKIDLQRRGTLTNLLELLFLTVLAFPKASRSGLDWRMMSLTCCEGADRQ